MTNDARLPVTVLTGFLGSGKTTVLNRLLAQPSLADTAVIINELGEIGIDHLLVDHDSERLQVLDNGCLCCTVRGDLREALHRLLQQRACGEVRFSRVLIETTGLADPVPVLQTLLADPALQQAYRLSTVVTTVDARHALGTLARYPEAVRQVAMADRLLLTKRDLVDAQAVQAVRSRLRALNPDASLNLVTSGEVDPALLLTPEVRAPGLHGRVGRVRLGRPAAGWSPVHGAGMGSGVQSYSFVFDDLLPKEAFNHWLELLGALRGERLLRVKGLVRLVERPEEPLVVHGVQHVFHPPRYLDAWPSADRRTRLVFIVQNLPRDDIERTFERFVLIRRESHERKVIA